MFLGSRSQARKHVVSRPPICSAVEAVPPVSPTLADRPASQLCFQLPVGITPQASTVRRSRFEQRSSTIAHRPLLIHCHLSQQVVSPAESAASHRENLLTGRSFSAAAPACRTSGCSAEACWRERGGLLIALETGTTTTPDNPLNCQPEFLIS